MPSLSMLTPKTGTESTFPKIHLLVSFPFFSNGIQRYLDEQDPSKFRLLVDSGAFSAWKSGRDIVLDDYIKFTRSLPSAWDVSFIQLDVIGNPVKTQENWLRMLDAGVSALPVFTRGADLAILDEYYQASPLVMFGGIVSGAGNKNYIRYFMENNQGRPVHWLGFAAHSFIKYYHPFSVDSTVMANWQRYGRLQYYAGSGQLKEARPYKYWIAHKPSPDIVQACLRVGFTRTEITQLQRAEAWKWGVNGMADRMSSAANLYRAISMERAVGTRYYTAVIHAHSIKSLFQAYEMFQERKVLSCVAYSEP